MEYIVYTHENSPFKEIDAYNARSQGEHYIWEIRRNFNHGGPPILSRVQWQMPLKSLLPGSKNGEGG